MHIRNIAIYFIFLTLSACSALETKTLVPKEFRTIDLPNSLSHKEALELFKVTSLNYFVFGKPKVTFRNNNSIEIGPWRKSNVAGYRGKAIIKNKKLSFVIKGTNVYYSKLPVLATSNNNQKRVKLESDLDDS